MSKFSFHLACFQEGEAKANFGVKVGEEEEERKKKND